MTVTVPAEISRHIGAYVGAAVAAVALVVAIVLGMAIADSDSTPAVRSSTVQQELPTRFGEGRGSPDAIEHRAVNDPARYGSPDAAEEWNR
jgi:hypothetical protein